MEHHVDGRTNCNNLERIGKGTGKLGNKMINGAHLDNSIVKIGQNAEKSPGDLGTLAVTQTLVEKIS